MKRFCAALLTLVLLLSLGLSGCKGEQRLDPNNPVTLTLWHNFGGQMKGTMDELMDTFNSTVGREKGILLSVVSVAGSADLQEKLTMAANGDPGAPELPDITTCYPKTALRLKAQKLLVELDSLFSEEELSAYLPRFVEEGRLDDGKLYVFPFAKSTEVLFLNQTLFDRFSAATGITMDCFQSFEGIAEAALRYYEWTDAQTPDVPNDGKTFYAADSWFNLAQVGVAQQGGSFVQNKALDCSSDAYRKIWRDFVLPAVQGGISVFDGYSSDLSKTGDIVCSVGSTAGILFYGDEITYADNTTEKVEFTVLPYPVYEGGKKIAIQRGGGMCVTRSTPQKEYAASVFLKWFTEPEQNMKFISSTGYLPVTNKAFEGSMEQEIQAVENENVRKLLRAAITMHREYDFYIPPTFDGFDTLESSYNSDLKQLVGELRASYLELLVTSDEDEALQKATDGALERFSAGR